MATSGTSPGIILDLLQARMKTEVLFAALKLNIPDTVHDLEPYADVEKIAAKLQLPSCTLSRLLNACAALGLLQINHDSDTKVVYHTTPVVQEWLLTSSERSLSTWIGFESVLDHTFRSQIPRLVQQGDDRLKDAPNVFMEMSRNPELAHMFSEGMAGLCQTSLSLTRAFDLSRYRSAVDLAGGVGVFAGELKKTYPDMELSVLELPITISQADTYWTKRGGQPDFTFIPGNMMEPGLPEVELYILSHVLHDHPDDVCNTILNNVSQALKPGGAVMIMEKVLPDPPDLTKPEAHVGDMYMLCVPLLARERTFTQYRLLLEAAGFGDLQFKENTGQYFYDAMLAFKK